MSYLDDPRAYVGPKDMYDVMGAHQFNVMTGEGLLETSVMCDVGCGSLRGGRLFIPYLNPMHYCGMEPNKWLVQYGLKELGVNMVGAEPSGGIWDIKKPRFLFLDSFDINEFQQTFDFVLLQSVFSHASIPLITRSLMTMKRALHENGKIIATFFLGDTDYGGEEDWVYPGGTSYKELTVKMIADSVMMKLTKLPYVHPNGQTWFRLEG